ncbi:GIY-YIG nuclease family protein [Bacillus thuringiensis]|uniref:GIY-YIG nuclease family protein n=1 Tax=Bacillus thuringiensis TaxID=1428 RepID=UPI001FAD3B12|nr:GIY-YIG nuclease family protein [Bacillus thuringiensis]MDM8361551.1 GIY-YIG nuclease family protein [Bacillus thuringiensis]
MEKHLYNQFNIEDLIENEFKLNEEKYWNYANEYPYYTEYGDGTIFNPVVAHFHESKDDSREQHILGLMMPIDEILKYKDIANPDTWKIIAENYPLAGGIYVFYGEDGTPIYVGETKNFLNRLREHISGEANTKVFKKFHNTFHPCNYFASVELYKLNVESEADRKVIERMMFYYKKPLHNWTTEKLKYPEENEVGRKYWRYLDACKGDAREKSIVFTKQYLDKLKVHFGHLSKEDYCKKYKIKNGVDSVDWSIEYKEKV